MIDRCKIEKHLRPLHCYLLRPSVYGGMELIEKCVYCHIPNLDAEKAYCMANDFFCDYRMVGRDLHDDVVDVIAEFKFKGNYTGHGIMFPDMSELKRNAEELEMNKNVIEIRVDEAGNPILYEEQQKHSKCPVCGKHGVMVLSVTQERVHGYGDGAQWKTEIDFICSHCAKNGGKLRCDSDYLKIEKVVMKKVSEYRFFARSNRTEPWQLILETSDKSEYELIRKYDFKLSRLFNQLNEDVKVEEKTEWVKV